MFYYKLMTKTNDYYVKSAFFASDLKKVTDLARYEYNIYFYEVDVLDFVPTTAITYYWHKLLEMFRMK